MNGMREKAIVKDIEGGQIHFFKEDNKLVLIKDDIGLVIEPVNPAFKLNISIGKKHYMSVFSKEAISLLEESSSFAETSNKRTILIYGLQAEKGF